MRSPAIRVYAAAAAAGVVAKGALFLAGFASLWLLNRVLDKEQFAAYAFTMAAVYLVGMVATFGLDRTLIYRISRQASAPGRLTGGGLAASALWAVLAAGAALALAVAFGAPRLAAGSDLPDLAFWFPALAAIVPLAAVVATFEAWYQSCHRSALSLLVHPLPDLGRAAFLTLASVAAGGAGAVAAAAVVAAVLPLLAWLAVTPADAYRPRQALTGADVSYGLKLMLTRVAHEGVRQIDVLMVGMLAPAAATADYTVVVRLVAAVEVGRSLLAPPFAPRMGGYLARGERRALVREYDRNRLLALAQALVTAALFAALGRPLLGLFGDFAAAYAPLLILSAGFLIDVGFGPVGVYLNMAGHAGWSFVIRLILLTAVVTTNLFLIPVLGGTGAALGTTVSLLGVNLLGSVVAWRLDRMPTLPPSTAAVLTAAVGLLLLAAFERVAGPTAGAGLVALLAATLMVGRAAWLPDARRALAGRL